MKTIYTISVDEDVPQSIDLIEHMKVLCYFIYDELRNMKYDSHESIICTDNLISNQLLESYVDNKYYYRFKYNDYSKGIYDPFMITDLSFGFTVNSDMINSVELDKVINKVKNLINFNYDIVIKSYSYMEDKDNKNRLNVLKSILMDEKVKEEENINSYKRVLTPVKVTV